MNGVRLKSLVALVLMVAAAAGMAAWKPRTHMSDLLPKFNLEAVFPQQFGDWRLDRGPVQLVSPDQQRVLNELYNQTLQRTYVNSKGQRVMLAVAYGGDQSDGTRAHRPELCYPAQGFQIYDIRRGDIVFSDHVAPVRKLVAKLGPRVEPITYWVTVGEKIAEPGLAQKITQMSYTTRGVVPDGMLVRVSTIGSDSETQWAVQQQFLVEMEAAFASDQKHRFFGT